MLIEIIALAVLSGRLLGGRFSRLGAVEFTGQYLLFAAVIIQALLPAFARIGSGPSVYLLIGSYTLIMIALALNRRTPGVTLIGLGVFLNFIVITANGGMPVANSAEFADKVHISLSSGTSLPWLADVIRWPLPKPFGGLVSLGDLALAAGVFAFIVRGMSYRGKRRVTTRSKRVEHSAVGHASGS